MPFLLASLASSLKSVGDLTLCQKMNDAEWKRTEMKSVAGGLLAGSIATTLAGALGGLGQSTFSSNVGLSAATGITSRSIALPFGVTVIALAFFPKLAAVFTSMPVPVMGAMLVYIASYMIIGGLQVLTSRMLDARKTFVVGVALFFGLSVEMVPGIYADVPIVLRPLVATSLALTTLFAVVLNLLFRIGVRRRAALELCGERREQIFAFLDATARAWERARGHPAAAIAIDGCYESVARGSPTGRSRSPRASTSSALDVEVSYDGKPLLFSTRRRRRPSWCAILPARCASPRS